MSEKRRCPVVMKKILFLAVVLMCLGTTVSASAVDPMDDLRESLEKILNLLEDPQYKEIDKKDLQRQKITAIIAIPSRRASVVPTLITTAQYCRPCWKS